jgi:amino acid permease
LPLPIVASPDLLYFPLYGPSDRKGFVCGWSYWFGRSISVAAQLVLIQDIMTSWGIDPKYGPLWIAVFYIPLILFNFLNARRYGEIEFWLTVIKNYTIIAIIILGIILPMGAFAGSRQLATGPDNTVAPCPDNPQPGQCVGIPGFTCIRI